MKQKTVYLYVLDTLADWEPGFATAELNSGRYFKTAGAPYTVKTVGPTKDPITTKGGLRIVPDMVAADVNPGNCGLLLLPGADSWQKSEHAAILSRAKEFLDSGITVAAICGATVAMAGIGLLEDRAHTSNDLGFLKATCPTYKGDERYVAAPAVTDANLITANGVAPLDFAYHILKKLDVFSRDTLEAWYKLYETHEPQYFYALMNSLPKSSA